MLTWSGMLTLYQALTDNSSTENQSVGGVLMNESIRYYCSQNSGKWWFLEQVTTQATVANQQAYILPQRTRKIVDLYVNVGSNVYSPVGVEDPHVWKRVLQSQLGTGDRTLFYYRQGNRVLLAPTPGSDGNTLTIRVRKNIADLSIADYTTGTVTMTQDDETVAGSGTTFTEAMEGRFIRATSGDYQWYEIADYTSATALELLQPYEGVTVAGSAFTLGQVSPLPEAYQELPVFRAASHYWLKDGDRTRADMFLERADILFDAMKQEANEKEEGAYMYPINDLIFRDPNIPEPNIPTASFI